MRFVALNTKYFEPKVLAALGKVGERGSFTIKSVMEDVGITDETQFVMLEGTVQTVAFTKRGQITKKGNVVALPPSPQMIAQKKQRGQPPPRTEYLQNFEHVVEEFLTKRNTLKDLEYSLKIVDNYNSPITHFQQQHRTLDEKDFETIQHGWIYIIRTAFGKLINALPRQNKLEFMLQCMDKFSTIDFKGTSLYDGYNFLLQYIEKRILDKGRLLVHTDNLLNKHFADILPVEEIGFVDPGKMRGNNLSEQASVFRNLFKLSDKGAEINQVINRSKSAPNDLEIRFEKIFKSQTWPIDLRA